MTPQPQKVVIDTNVIISSLWGGNPKKVLALWQQGYFKVLVSLPILQEYQKVLNRFKLSEDDLEAFLSLFTAPQFSILVRPRYQHHVIKEDPSDNIFLDCALEGKANCIVSGDIHLLKLKIFENIPILTPTQFIHESKS